MTQKWTCSQQCSLLILLLKGMSVIILTENPEVFASLKVYLMVIRKVSIKLQILHVWKTLSQFSLIGGLLWLKMVWNQEFDLSENNIPKKLLVFYYFDEKVHIYDFWQNEYVFPFWSVSLELILMKLGGGK